MATFKNIVIQQQGVGSGFVQPATLPTHAVRKKEFDAAVLPLQENAHTPVTKQDSQSVVIAIANQQITASVRRKLTGLSSAQASLAVDDGGLYIPLGTGANQAASGSDLAVLSQALSDKANTVHAHTIASITGLQAALDAKASTQHAHLIADVTGLQAALDAKASTTHTHVISSVSGLQAALDGKSATDHSHEIADVTGLQNALDALTLSIGSLSIASIAGLSTALNAKAAASHAHTIADISGLQEALNGKSGVAHTHSAATTTDSGFMSSSDKTKLDSLSANTKWLPDVASKSDLPLNISPEGACRLVRSEGRVYQCISTVGLVDDQWRRLRNDNKYAATIGDGASTSILVAHGLATEDVTVSVRLAGNGKEFVDCGMSVVDANTVRLDFGMAPGSGVMRVVVNG